MSISREVLERYVGPGVCFVETGARWGDTMIRAMELGASQVRSCESDYLQHAMAWAHVRDALRDGPWFLHQGESTRFLRDYSPCTSLQVVYFLDAHTETKSPLLAEIDLIRETMDKRWIGRPVTILIDDWRIVQAGTWGFGVDHVFDALTNIGPHTRTFEPGVVPEDILVARFE